MSEAKVAIIVPTYNERDNIGRLIEEILKLELNGVVVVVDDNSPDKTAEVVERYIKVKKDKVKLIKRPSKMGLGTAYIAGFKEMLKDPDVQYFITMDADFSHNPRFIPDLLYMIKEADVVIGSRYIKGGKTLKFAIQRRIISRGANMFAKLMLGLVPNDCTSGFRCYRRVVLETIDLDSIFSTGYSFLVEMLYRVTLKNFTVKEVPITYVARAHGLSKISTDEIINTAKTIIKLRFMKLK